MMKKYKNLSKIFKFKFWEDFAGSSNNDKND